MAVKFLTAPQFRGGVYTPSPCIWTSLLGTKTQ